MTIYGVIITICLAIALIYTASIISNDEKIYKDDDTIKQN